MAEPSRPVDHRDLVIESLAADVTALAATVRPFRELTSATWDYVAWLQAELCRARRCGTLDILEAWWQELDRRAKARDEIAA